MISKKRQQSGIIDCTFTIASISSISRFACAIAWLVWVITSSVYVTFARICFAFVNICQKKREKEKRMKWDLVFIREPYMYMCENPERSLAIFWFHVIL